MPAVNLAQVKNLKLHWTQISRNTRGKIDRKVDFSVGLSECKSVKKMVIDLGKHIEPLSQQVENAIYLVLHEIGYWEVTWKLRQRHLIAFQDAVNERVLKK